MKRAAILIGVQKTATLPELSAVWTGVKEMEEWARDQGMEFRSLSDEGGPSVGTNLLAESLGSAVTRLSAC